MPDDPSSAATDASSTTTSSEPSSPPDASTDRRQFAKNMLLGTAGAGLLAGCGSGADESDAPNVQTEQNVRWRLASSYGQSLDILWGGAERLAERVRTLTDGRFDIRTYAGGEIVPPFGVLSNVQSGTVQMGHSASYYYIGQNPALAFDCTVPFGLTARQYNAWMYEGGGLELMRGLFSDFNIINFPGGNTGTQMGGWFLRDVQTLDDMRGLKMRIPGLGGEVMSKLGVNTQVLPGSEIYPSLERGAIDAAEWVGPYNDEKLGFHEIAPYYYYPGWWEPGPAVTFYVNRDAYDALPSRYQEVLEIAAAEVNVRMLAEYDRQNPAALDRILDEDVTLRRFPDGVMRRGREITTAILEDNATGNGQYREIYDAYTSARENMYRWFNTAEQAYASFAFPSSA